MFCVDECVSSPFGTIRFDLVGVTGENFKDSLRRCIELNRQILYMNMADRFCIYTWEFNLCFGKDHRNKNVNNYIDEKPRGLPTVK